MRKEKMPPITRSPSWASSAGCAASCSLHTDSPLPANRRTRRSSHSNGMALLCPPGQANRIHGCWQGFIHIQQQGGSCQGRTGAPGDLNETKQFERHMITAEFIIWLKCNFSCFTLMFPGTVGKKGFLIRIFTVMLVPFLSYSFLCFSLVSAR